MKTCYTCKISKELQDYSPNNRKKDGLDPNCKTCRRERANRYYNNPSPEKVRDENGKVCSKCNEFKIFDEFGVRKNASDGRKSACKSCLNNEDKQYYNENIQKESDRKKLSYQENKTEILEKCKDYRESNKEDISKRRSEDRQVNPEKYKEYGKNWRDKNPGWMNQYAIKRRENDPLFKLQCNIRSRTNALFRYNKWTKTNSFKQYIGCSLEELKIHIEKQFVNGMTWENQGEWHLDHIQPLSSAKTTEELFKLCHYKNLQPLWAIDNLKKCAKIIK